MIATKRNFRRGDKAGTFVFYSIDIRFASARIKTDTAENFFFCDIRGNKRGKSVLAQNIQAVQYQRLFQKHGFIFEVVKLYTGDLCRSIKVD